MHTDSAGYSVYCLASNGLQLYVYLFKNFVNVEKVSNCHNWQNLNMHYTTKLAMYISLSVHKNYHFRCYPHQNLQELIQTIKRTFILGKHSQVTCRVTTVLAFIVGIARIASLHLYSISSSDVLN